MKFMLLWLSLTTLATWRPEYAQLSDTQRQWFRDQRNPGTKVPCCSEADGAQAQEDILDGRYRVRFTANRDTSGAPREIDSGWMDVPQEAVLQGPNLNGAPVVWWYWTSEHNVAVLKVRCFSPGAKL